MTMESEVGEVREVSVQVTVDLDDWVAQPLLNFIDAQDEYARAFKVWNETSANPRRVEEMPEKRARGGRADSGSAARSQRSLMMFTT
jgi:hypothetical protein